MMTDPYHKKEREAAAVVHGDFGSCSVWVMMHVSAERAGWWQWHLRFMMYWMLV